MDQHPLSGTDHRPDPRTVRLATPFVSGESQADVLAGELGFDPRDPFAVTMHLFATGGRVTWTFARDLLAEGLYEPSGDGDVHVWPCLDSEGHAVVIIELCSPDGEALVQAKTNDLSTFVERMSAAVGPGCESEHLDVDATIAAIFEAEAA